MYTAIITEESMNLEEGQQQHERQRKDGNAVDRVLIYENLKKT